MVEFGLLERYVSADISIMYAMLIWAQGPADVIWSLSAELYGVQYNPNDRAASTALPQHP